MTKAFKKGDIVIHVSSYDNENTFCFQRARVESCGVKKMTLSSVETGKMMGCDFYPGLGFNCRGFNPDAVGSDRPVHHYVRYGTFRDMTDAEAEALCLELAASFLAYEIRQLSHTLAEHRAERGEDHYSKHIAEKISRLEALAPAALKR